MIKYETFIQEIFLEIQQCIKNQKVKYTHSECNMEHIIFGAMVVTGKLLQNSPKLISVNHISKKNE